MGTGATAESQGVRSDTPAPAPTQTELAQIVANAVAASRQQEPQQAQYVPPQASIYTPPEQTLYTPPAQTLYTPQAEQTATPGITALLPQDQGAQTLMPTASVYTPPAASVYTPPETSIYTPPAASVYTPPAPSVFTPAPPSVSTPEDKGRTMGPTQTADAPVAQNPFVPPETAVPAQTNAAEPEPAQKPADLTESEKQRNYWSNESEAFARVMSGMESGKAQLKNQSLGTDEFGNEMTQLVLTTGEHPGYDTLVLQPTEQPGIYQFSTRNQVAGGMIHGVVQADPKTGTYKPVQDYTKQIRYTPGSKGGFLGGMIGDFGDIFKSLGPIAPIIGNAIAPGLGSALGAVAALDEGNTSGALLSGLSAAGAYGGDAARNALAAEVSGNADLASQYSSGLGGALAQNLPEIKTATSAAQLANALDKGNLLGAINAGVDLTGTQISPEFRTGIAGLGLAQAIASGNVPQAMVLGSQFLPPAASGADVGPPAPPSGGISSLMPAATQAEAPAETPALDQQVATADTNLPADTDAGLAQLVKAFTEPETTSSYTGTQVADLTGTTGLPTDVPSEQDLDQLGVGLPALTETKELPQETATQDTTGGLDALAQQQAELDRIANEEHERVLAEEAQNKQERPEFDPEEPTTPTEPNPVDDLEAEQKRIEQELEDELRQEQAYWRLVEQRRLEQGEETPDDTTVANDGTTGGIEDLIKTLPADLGDFEGVDMTGGGGEPPNPDVAQEVPVDDDTTPGIQEVIDTFTPTSEETNMTDYSNFDADQIANFDSTDVAPVFDYSNFDEDQIANFDSTDVAPGDENQTLAETNRLNAQNATATGTPVGKTSWVDDLANNLGVSPGLLKLIASGLGLGGLGSLLGQQQQAPAPTPYTGALSNIKMGANYTPYTYKPYADGGAVQSSLLASQGVLPVGYNLAAGGIASLGGYSDGGRLLRGPGDGVSDSIPAVIGNKQPARLADGEFVIPARIVSELGNGSTEAGARQLYAMMDRIQSARRKTTGKDKVAANTKAAKHLPA